MRTDGLQRICELTAEQMNHWTLFHVALAVMGVTAGYVGVYRPNAVMWALCGVLPAMFFFARERVDRFLPFLLIHLSAPAAVFLIPVQSKVERCICAVCAAGYAFFSFSRRLRENGRYTQPFTPAACLALAIPAAICQHRHGIPGWGILHVILLVAGLALYQLTGYVRRYLEFVSVNAGSAGCLPAGDMFRSGMRMASVYTLAVSAVLLFCTDVGGGLAAAGDRLRSLLAAAGRFLLSLLPENMPEMRPEPSAALPEPGRGTPLLLAICLRILTALLLAGMAVLTVLAAAKLLAELVRQIRLRFTARTGAGGENVRDGVRDMREKCGTEDLKRTERSRRRPAFWDPAQKVRRMYRRRVLAEVRELSGPSGRPEPALLCRMTARECGRRLQAAEMAEVYELARYSRREITAETVRRMRRACKKKSAPEKEIRKI